MTIELDAPPSVVLKALEANLRRLAQAADSAVPATRVEVCRPLPVYEMETADDYGAIDSAVRVSWRFAVLPPDHPFWIDIPEEGPADVLEGPDVANLLEAAARLEAAADGGTASVLDYPLIGSGAVRVTTPERDHFWEYAPALGTRPVDRNELIAAWLARQQSIAAGSTMSIE